MVSHLTLKGLSISELLFLQAGSQPWTSTSNSDQVFFIDGVANIENFDNFAALLTSLQDSALVGRPF